MKVNDPSHQLVIWWVYIYIYRTGYHPVGSRNNTLNPLRYTDKIHLSLQWRHKERNGVSNHQPHDCLLNCFFKAQIKENIKFRVTGFCKGNSPVTGEFHLQGASNAEMFPFVDVIV